MNLFEGSMAEVVMHALAGETIICGGKVAFGARDTGLSEDDIDAVAESLDPEKPVFVVGIANASDVRVWCGEMAPDSSGRDKYLSEMWLPTDADRHVVAFAKRKDNGEYLFAMRDLCIAVHPGMPPLVMPRDNVRSDLVAMLFEICDPWQYLGDTDESRFVPARDRRVMLGSAFWHFENKPITDCLTTRVFGPGAATKLMSRFMLSACSKTGRILLGYMADLSSPDNSCESTTRMASCCIDLESLSRDRDIEVMQREMLTRPHSNMWIVSLFLVDGQTVWNLRGGGSLGNKPFYSVAKAQYQNDGTVLYSSGGHVGTYADKIARLVFKGWPDVTSEVVSRN